MSPGTAGTSARATVSVVIPAFNCAEWIGRALQSVDRQTRPVDEIIVVDDASTDNPREFVHAPVRYVRHEWNRGVSAARNTGVRMTAGDYLVFLDADDELAPDAVEKMLHATETAGASWCITDVYRITGDAVSISRFNPPDGDPLLAILAMDFVTRGFFFRRADFEEIGMYDETLRACEDWEIFIRMMEAGKPFCYLAEPVYRYHRRKGSLTTGHVGTVLACNRRILEIHHRRLAARGEEFNRAWAAALWFVGRRHWEAKHRLAGAWYGVRSVLCERSLQRPGRFLRRIIGLQPRRGAGRG
jgi:glycosyltransferase involved in cell wall biosynthesis